MEPDNYRVCGLGLVYLGYGYRDVIRTLKFKYWFDYYGSLNYLFAEQGPATNLIFQGCKIIDKSKFKDGLKYIKIDEI